MNVRRGILGAFLRYLPEADRALDLSQNALELFLRIFGALQHLGTEICFDFERLRICVAHIVDHDLLRTQARARDRIAQSLRGFIARALGSSAGFLASHRAIYFVSTLEL